MDNLPLHIQFSILILGFTVFWTIVGLIALRRAKVKARKEHRLAERMDQNLALLEAEERARCRANHPAGRSRVLS
jgi:hypothetical protein